MWDVIIITKYSDKLGGNEGPGQGKSPERAIPRTDYDDKALYQLLHLSVNIFFLLIF